LAFNQKSAGKVMGWVFTEEPYLPAKEASLHARINPKKQRAADG
jgi:hypothetical protein